MLRLTRVKVILGVGVMAIGAAFILDMSGSAPRMADTDHTSAAVFSATVPGGGTVCQPIGGAPDRLGSVRLLIGTYGRPVPPLNLRFLDSRGRSLASGSLAAVHEGLVTVRLSRTADISRATQACLHVGGSHTVVLGGEAGPGGSETVNGRRQPGDISLTYLRPGSETWWQLLPTLDTRFGLGKASFFGDWTLPVLAVLLIATCIGSIRLIARESR